VNRKAAAGFTLALPRSVIAQANDAVD